jgi:hypothetical protein
MFRLQKEGGRLHAIQGRRGGKKSLSFEVNTALRLYSTHPAAFPAIGGRVFLSLTRTSEATESP